MEWQELRSDCDCREGNHCGLTEVSCGYRRCPGNVHGLPHEPYEIANM